jgi:hypothetical protein
LESIELATLIDPLKTTMKDKSPLIAKQSVEFLQTAIKRTFIDDFKKLYSTIAED